MTMTKEDFASYIPNLKEIRENAKIKQETMATELGVRQPKVAEYEKEPHTIPYLHLLMWLKVCSAEVPPAKLFAPMFYDMAVNFDIDDVKSRVVDLGKFLILGNKPKMPVPTVAPITADKEKK